MNQKYFLALSLLVSTSLQAFDCQNPLWDDQDVPFLAVSSLERGYFRREMDQEFLDYLAGLRADKANRVCRVLGCGDVISFRVDEGSNQLPWARARVIYDGRAVVDYVDLRRPWNYRSLKPYQMEDEVLWNFGHGFSMGTIASSYGFRTFGQISVIIGQLSTIISRRFGRYNYKIENYAQAKHFQEKGQRLEIDFIEEMPRVGYEVFSSLQCSQPDFLAIDIR